MQREGLAQAPAVSAALADEEIAAIEERIALAQRLLDEEKPDEAALALEGALWRMAEMVGGERHALRAPDVRARLAHLGASLARVEQNEPMNEPVNEPMAEWDAFGGAGPCMRIAPWKGSGYDGD